MAPRIKSTIKGFSDVDASYIAGIIDGEGTICFQKTAASLNSTQIRIEVGVTDEDLIDWLIKTTGIGIKMVIEGARPGYKTVYRWSVHRINDVLDLSRQVFPFLHIERRKIRIQQVLEEKGLYI